jgi:hypothetical protein
MQVFTVYDEFIADKKIALVSPKTCVPTSRSAIQSFMLRLKKRIKNERKQ